MSIIGTDHIETALFGGFCQMLDLDAPGAAFLAVREDDQAFGYGIHREEGRRMISKARQERDTSSIAKPRHKRRCEKESIGVQLTVGLNIGTETEDHTPGNDRGNVA